MDIPQGLKKYICEKLLPFRAFPEDKLTLLLDKMEVVTCSPDTVLFQQGETQGEVFYLLVGKIELQAEEGQPSIVEPDMDEALYPLSNMLPRRYTVTARQASQFLKLDRDSFNQLTSEAGERSDVNAGGSGLAEVEDLDWMSNLLQSQIFTRIPVGNIQQIFALFEELLVKPGEQIIRQGDSGDYYYIIKEGCFNVLRKGKKKKEFTLAVLHEGEGFGEEALIGNIPRNASVVSENKGKLLRISKKDFLTLVRDPAIQMLAYADALKLVKAGAVLMDVRFQEEFGKSALPASINFPLDTLRIQIKKINPQRKYIVCCDDGTRSAIAAFLMLEQGFDVHCIEAGIGEYLDRLDSNATTAGSGPPAVAGTAHGKSNRVAAVQTRASRGAGGGKAYNAEAIAKSLINKRSNMEDLTKALSEVLSNVYTQLEQALREKSEAEIAKKIAESKLENFLKFSE